MPKFQVTVADEAGHKLYDESIEASGPLEACAKAVADAQTANVADTADRSSDRGLRFSIVSEIGGATAKASVSLLPAPYARP